MPKNFDPKVDPDPERWLPRKDRSTYKGRRRDKRKDAAGIGKGTQGGVANVEGLDASKPPPGEDFVVKMMMMIRRRRRRRCRWSGKQTGGRYKRG